MSVLSWIFQPVYLIFFVIIAALYIYRAEFLPEHRDVEQSRELIARMEQAATSIEVDANKVSVITATTVEHQQSSKPVVQQKVVQLSEPEHQSTGELSAAINIQQKTDTDVLSKAVDVDSATQLAEVVTVIDEAQVEEHSPPSLGELWYAARRSARVSDLNQAIASYIHLTSIYPQHADGFGELGNLYYAQGDLERATTAYQQALFIYQSLGASGEALQLQKIIAGLGRIGDS